MNFLIALCLLFSQTNEEFLTAKKAYDNKLYDIAVLGFEEFLRGGYSQPDAADGLYYLAESYLQLGKLSNAALKFHLFAQQFPADPRQDKTLGQTLNCYLNGADPLGGFRLFRDFPNRLSPSELNQLATALKSQGENQKAFEVYSSLGSREGAFDAARTLLSSGDVKKAREYLWDLAKADTLNAARAYFEIIKSYLQEGDTLSALEILPKLKNTSRLSPRESWELARFLLWLNNTEGAIACLNQAKADKDLEPQVVKNLALIYRRAHDYRSEEQMLKKLVGLTPNDQEAKLDLDRTGLLLDETFNKSTALYWNFLDSNEFARVVSKLNDRGCHQEARALLEVTSFASPVKSLLAAKTYEELKEYQKARDFYAEFIKNALVGDDVAAAELKISYLDNYMINDYETAMKQLLTAENDGERGSVLFTLAKDYASAIRYLEKSETPRARYLLGRSYELLYQKDKADSIYNKTLKTYESFLTDFPQDLLYEEVLYHLIRLTEKKSSPADQISAFENFSYQYPVSRFADTVLFNLAQLYYQTGNVTVCIDRLNQLIPLFPQSPLHDPALYFLAQADLWLNDTLSAQEQFSTLALTGQDSIRYLSLRALARLAANDPGRARSYLQQLVSGFPYPKESDMLDYLEILIQLKEPEKVIDFVAQSRDPGSGLKFYKALALAQLGHKPLALTMLYSLGLPNLPAEYYYYRAVIARELDRPVLAQMNLEMITKGQKPEMYYNQARVMLAQFYYQKKDYKHAASIFEELLSVTPDSLQYFEPLITSLYKSGDLVRADSLLRRYEGDTLQASGLHLVKINYYLETNQLDKAQAELENLVRTDSSAIASEETQYDQALLVFKKGDFTQAATAFENFLLLFPTSRYANLVQFKLGTTYNRLGDNTKSLEFYKLASADDSLKLSALFNIAYVYKEEGDLPKAIEIYTRVLSENQDLPDRADIEFSLAYAHLLNRDYLKSADLFRAILEKTQDRQRRCEATYWLAESYLGLGRLDAAAFEYLKIPYNYPELEAWPVTAELKAGLCFELMGKLDKAKDIYKGILKRHPNDDWGNQAKEKLQELEKKQP